MVNDGHREVGTDLLVLLEQLPALLRSLACGMLQRWSSEQIVHRMFRPDQKE
jgi:hypothetical protein